MVESSFKNGMDAIESIHRTTAEMPLEVLKEFGFPEDTIETARASHRRILRVLYGGICSAQAEFGKLAVLQVSGLAKFLGDMTGGGNWNPPAEKRAPAGKVKVKKRAAKKAAGAQPDGGQTESGTAGSTVPE